MMLKSKSHLYGPVAVSIYWISAVLILASLGSGFQAGSAMDPAAEVGNPLRVHIPMAIFVLLLTVVRILWWWRFDLKPQPVQGSPA